MLFIKIALSDYFNKTKKLPTIVDSSRQFILYKMGKCDDITYDYFEHYDRIADQIVWDDNTSFNIIYDGDHAQFTSYKQLDHQSISPFIKKYFSPSIEIQNLISTIEHKYNLGGQGNKSYRNICVLHHRGNDKITETTLCPYEETIRMAKEILKDHPSINFLIQSDETEFIEKFTMVEDNERWSSEDGFRFFNRTRYCNPNNLLVLKHRKWLIIVHEMKIEISI
jgi:hypothetical protein